MRTLHEEAIEQLELMKTVLDAGEETAGTLRDTLDDISSHHWHAYMDIIHLITLHDETMSSVIKKYGLILRDQNDAADRPGISPALLTLLIIALIRRHRRIWHIYGRRASPMGDYLKESLVMEREHIAKLITIVQDLI